MTGASRAASGGGGRDGLYWESTGTGAPVLLIMGLGLTGGAWWRTVPALSRRLRVITFDNRGVGRSKALTHTYTTEAMADDAAAVLDAAGVEQAHVYGFSLGGMVAQQLTLRHPRRVRSLVLGATHPGGPRVTIADDDVLAFFRQRSGMPAEEAAWASVPFNYGPRCRAEHVDRIAEDIERRLAHPFPERAYRAQLYAAALHNCFGRLGRLHVPTLIVHGRHDRVIPVSNARLMAERIPGAELRIRPESVASIRSRLTSTRCPWCASFRRRPPTPPASARGDKAGAGRCPDHITPWPLVRQSQRRAARPRGLQDPLGDGPRNASSWSPRCSDARTNAPPGARDEPRRGASALRRLGRGRRSTPRLGVRLRRRRGPGVGDRRPL